MANGWKRSPVGKQWKRTINGKDGKTQALLDVQAHGNLFYWQVSLRSGGTPNGTATTLADAKAQAEKAVK